MLGSSIPNVTRPVYPGEAVTLEVSTRFTAQRWSVYLRTDPTVYSVRLGGWNPDTSAYEPNTALDLTLSAVATMIAGEESGPEFSEVALEEIREASDGRRDTQTIWYDDDGAAVSVVTLDFGDVGATTLDGLISRDQEYLEALQDARTAAVETNGIAVLELPDGRKETYRSLLTLDAQIATVADRIARDLAGRSGARTSSGIISANPCPALPRQTWPRHDHAKIAVPRPARPRRALISLRACRAKPCPASPPSRCPA